MISISNLDKLYESDYYEWLAVNIELLKNRQLESLDYENLIEELESLGRSEKAGIETLIIRIIQHLLFYQYWTKEFERNGKHWEIEIINFRIQVELRLTTNFRNHLINRLPYLYAKASKLAAKKSELSLPNSCPYCLEEILDEDWLPR